MDRVDINFQKNIYIYILLSFFSWQIFVACKEGVYIIVKNSLEIKCGFSRFSENNELETVKKCLYTCKHST